jgi:hypothetical protein
MMLTHFSSYVDGIMHGEIVREFDKGEYQAQKFCII